MQLRPGVENELVRRQTRVRNSSSHPLRRAINNEIPEKILPLPERTVILLSGIKHLQPIEKRPFRRRPESLQICPRVFGGSDALVPVIVPFVAVVVDEQRDFGEVAAFELSAGEGFEGFAVDGGAVVEVSESVEAGGRGVGVYVGLLGGCFEGLGWEGAEAL